ncbi:MAG: DnaJ domain-containing protein [Nitrospirae bacterium]|nr:DnaJ domain-containing protein [Nitrospirota bacterium]
MRGVWVHAGCADRRCRLRFFPDIPQKYPSRVIHFDALLFYPIVVVRKTAGGQLDTKNEKDKRELQARLTCRWSFPVPNSPIRFAGRVASCRAAQRQSGDRYAVGIEFLRLTERDLKVLTRFIEYYGRLADEQGKGKAPPSGEGKASATPSEFAERIEYLYVWHRNMGYYRVLGVKDYATEDEIRDAYRSMVREFHPDRHFDRPSEVREKLHAILTYVNAAYETLTNAERRKEYDVSHVYRIRG